MRGCFGKRERRREDPAAGMRETEEEDAQGSSMRSFMR